MLDSHSATHDLGLNDWNATFEFVMHCSISTQRIGHTTTDIRHESYHANQDRHTGHHTKQPPTIISHTTSSRGYYSAYIQLHMSDPRHRESAVASTRVVARFYCGIRKIVRFGQHHTHKSAVTSMCRYIIRYFSEEHVLCRRYKVFSAISAQNDDHLR